MKKGIGARLRTERERLGLSQSDFAAQTGVTRNTQANYEAEERSPDANYLAAAGSLGVNVPFVLVGKTLSAEVSAREIDFLDKFRQCTPAVQSGIYALMQTVLASK
jgi:transcriptional regulator with XRE-family HTH domain